jgi:dipicolinate synthase subunit B
VEVISVEKLKGMQLGFAISGSFCTISKVYDSIQKLVNEGANVYPIMSENASRINTRFGESEDFKNKLEEITGNEVMMKIEEVEKIGPNNIIDAIIVAPCTGNTLGKMANGITDTSVLMAIKATLRTQTPVILGEATNDGIGLNLKNLGTLINTKNIYFIPFGQDNYKSKVNSLISKFELTFETLIGALEGEQIQPILVNYK